MKGGLIAMAASADLLSIMKPFMRFSPLGAVSIPAYHTAAGGSRP